MITKYSFFEINNAGAHRIVLWEHHDDGENCEDVKCVAEIVEFTDKWDGHYRRDLMKALTRYYFTDDKAWAAAWRERTKTRE